VSVDLDVSAGNVSAGRPGVFVAEQRLGVGLRAGVDLDRGRLDGQEQLLAVPDAAVLSGEVQQRDTADGQRDAGARLLVNADPVGLRMVQRPGPERLDMRADHSSDRVGQLRGEPLRLRLQRVPAGHSESR
jgi:hypothetical protein